MEIKVLGSVSPYCKGDKNCPGYLITEGQYKILLDCGNGITRLLNMPDDLKNLYVFISHLHKDHYADLLSIGYTSYVYNNLAVHNRVKVFIPNMYYLPDNIYMEGIEDFKLINSMDSKYITSLVYNGESRITVGDFEITFFKNFHSDMDSYSIKVRSGSKTIVYTGDTGYKIIEELSLFADSADLLISEASLLKTDPYPNSNHLTASEAAQIAKKANVKKLILTHFWPEHNPNEYYEEAKEIFPNVDIATEGKIIKL